MSLPAMMMRSARFRVSVSVVVTQPDVWRILKFRYCASLKAWSTTPPARSASAITARIPPTSVASPPKRGSFALAISLAASSIAVESSTSVPLTEGLAGGSLRSKPATDWLQPFLTTLRPASVDSTSRSSASVPQNGLTTFSNRCEPECGLGRGMRDSPPNGGARKHGMGGKTTREREVRHLFSPFRLPRRETRGLRRIASAGNVSHTPSHGIALGRPGGPAPHRSRRRYRLGAGQGRSDGRHPRYRLDCRGGAAHGHELQAGLAARRNHERLLRQAARRRRQRRRTRRRRPSHPARGGRAAPLPAHAGFVVARDRERPRRLKAPDAKGAALGLRLTASPSRGARRCSPRARTSTNPCRSPRI